MPRECSDCGAPAPDGAVFCPRCGHRLGDGMCPGASAYGIVGIVAAALVTISLTIAVAYIAVNIEPIFGCLTDVGKVIFIGCAAVFAFCTVYAVRGAVASAREGPERLGRSGWAGVGKGLAVLMAFSYAYVIMTMLLGTEIDSSELSKYSEYQLAAMLFMAGPREEILYRLLPIGIPMAILFLACGRKGGVSCVMGGFGASKAAWVLIIVAATIFGIAHLDGWNAAKVPQAFVSGVILGYLYVEYGLYASVLVHSGLDLMSVGANLVPAITGLEILALCTLGIILIVMAVTSGNLSKMRLSEKWLGDDVSSRFLDRWDRHRSLPEDLFQPLLRFHCGFERFRLDYPQPRILLEAGHHKSEVDVPVADGEVLVLAAVVVVDVDVPYPVPERIYHFVDLAHRVRMPYVERYAQVSTVDDAPELVRSGTQHDGDVRHVLDADVRYPEIRGRGLDAPAGIVGCRDAPLPATGHGKGGESGMDGHRIYPELRRALHLGYHLAHGSVAHTGIQRTQIGVGDRGVDGEGHPRSGITL